MTRASALVLAMLLFGLTAGRAADNPVVGKWECISADDSGQESTWTLTVNDEGGKLSGTLAGGQGEFELTDPKLEGNTFTFKIIVNGDAYSIETKIDGKKLDGTFKGPEASGTLKGTKQS